MDWEPTTFTSSSSPNASQSAASAAAACGSRVRINDQRFLGAPAHAGVAMDAAEYPAADAAARPADADSLFAGHAYAAQGNGTVMYAPPRARPNSSRKVVPDFSTAAGNPIWVGGGLTQNTLIDTSVRESQSPVSL